MLAHQSANANFEHGATTRLAPPTQCRCPRRPGARRGEARPVDDRDQAQPVKHRPHRRQVPEPFVLAAHRFHRRSPGQLRHDLLRGTQILLRHDPRLPVHPSRFHQVVVRVLPAALPPRSTAYMGNILSCAEKQAPQPMPRRSMKVGDFPLGVVRETARLLAAERLRAPMRLAFWLSPSASSRSAGPIHGSGWIEAKIS